ncbi:MAG TPA: hypothetical protein VNH18_06730, partial [Bryobacteraceae bacterium]|nr:hypothetical protein [Bryobacteraceae bacterium]
RSEMDGSRTTVDLKRLAAEVSVQHGIRVDPDDPMMAVVTLNRLVFEEAGAQLLNRVQAAVRDFEIAADKVQVRAGSVLAQEVRDSGLAMRQEAKKMLEEFRCAGLGGNDGIGRGHPAGGDRKWFVIGLAFALMLFATGVWIGARLR